MSVHDLTKVQETNCHNSHWRGNGKVRNTYQELKLGDTQERTQAATLSYTAQLAVASISAR
jgi:hypothetical protein